MKRSLLYQIDDAPDDAKGNQRGGSFRAWVGEVSLADELEIDTVWCLPNAGEQGDFRLGTPELWLAALARSTSTVRLGWGLASMLPPTRPPIRSAEQAASIDLLSGGRLAIALLPGVAPTAAGTPGDDAIWAEGFRMLVEMWDGPTFSWTSPQFEVPPVDVLPKPLQQPHPPLAAVGWTETHAERAGREGLGYFDVSGANDERLEVHRDAYCAARAESNPEDLVATSLFAAALDLGVPSELEDRLDRWRELDFDEAVLRLPTPTDLDSSEANRTSIRWLAEATASLH